ncbi:hypothetical protein ABZV34_37210 [Streptomyces sp. NPDC005195]|uniref:hypothetical protein n=1 Tax=Streptomyces sp. NPDC005195 TaxID=3154561 RepID=UPI0033BF6698
MIDLDSPGAPDETPTDADEFGRLLAEASRRPLPFDLPGNYQYLLLQPPPITDLDWSADATWPPTSPETIDEIWKSLDIDPGTDTATAIDGRAALTRTVLAPRSAV